MEGLAQHPVVSVVVPMLDEAGFIEPCLASFESQSWPQERLEVLVVDGGSTDGSRQFVEEYSREHPWVRIVENPDRRASAAFNRGVEASTGEILCLFSAHGVAHPDYVANSVAVLRETGAAGVGGRYLHEGLDPVSRSIGLAMVSPFGMASPHRFATRRTVVDTISHPAYRRMALTAAGPFDESLLRNSDYELNVRLRDAGATLVFDPSVESIYRPRGSLRALARQFWWYGRWKVRVLRRHPHSLKARHLVPPAAVAVSVGSIIGSPWRPARRLLLVGAVGYGATLSAAVLRARPRASGGSALVFVAALPTMHLSWGAGFLWSLLEDLRGEPR